MFGGYPLFKETPIYTMYFCWISDDALVSMANSIQIWNLFLCHDYGHKPGWWRLFLPIKMSKISDQFQRKVVFQPPFFRGNASFREGTSTETLLEKHVFEFVQVHASLYPDVKTSCNCCLFISLKPKRESKGWAAWKMYPFLFGGHVQPPWEVKLIS